MRRTVVESIAVAVLAVVAAVVLLRLWDADLGVPFADAGDAKFYGALTKTLDDGNWYFENPQLGAPFDSQLYDLPLGGENLQLAVLKGLTLFTGWATAYNLYFLLGFPLVALAAFHVARRFARLSAGASLVVAMLYAFLPYHFARGETHPLLANYAAVPIGCTLVLAVASGWQPNTRRDWWLVIGACVLLGVTSTYYAIFTGLLLMGLSLLVALARRELRAAILGVGLAGVIAVTLLVNVAPSLVYWAANGTNSVATRSTTESETFGLKMSQLVLPAEEHRLSPLADFTARARRETALPSETGGAVGLVGTAGLMVALVAALARVLGRDRRDDDQDPTRPALLGVAIIVSLLLALIGGLAFVLSLGGFRAIRGWNRISVFIAFFALLVVGRLLDGARERMRARGIAGPWATVLLAGVLVVGLLDQTPSSPVDFDEVEARFATEATFVRSIENRLGADADVFQLPIVPYPEAGPRVHMDDYDHLRGYLHSETLRWSYGATKGREGIWLEELDPLAPLVVVDAAAAAGFDALWVDRAGYPDNGASVEAGLAPYLGDLHHSADERRWFADLRPLERRLRHILGGEGFASVREAALHPVREEWARGFRKREVTDGVPTRWARAEAELRILNPGGTTRSVVLRLGLAETSGSVTVTWPGGSAEVRVGEPVVLTFDVAPGANTVQFSAPRSSERELPDGRRVAFRLVDPDVVDAVVLDAADKLAAS